MTTWRGRPVYPTRHRFAAAMAMNSGVGPLLERLPEAEPDTPLNAHEIAQALESAVEPEQLLTSLMRWIPASEELLVAGDISALPVWVVSIVLIADLATRQPESPLGKYAPQVLARARERTTAWEFHGARSWIELVHAWLAIARKEIGLARLFALAADAESQAASSSKNAFDLVPPDPISLSALFSHLAKALLEVRAVAPAIELAKVALTRYQDNDQAVHTLGQAYAALERWEDAADAWRRYSEIHPDRPVGFMNHASSLASLEKMDEALAVAEPAMRLAPDDPQMLYGHGVLLESAGRMREAAADFRAAYRLATSKEMMFQTFGELMQVLIATGDTDAARAELEALKSSDRLDWQDAGYFYGALVAYRAGDEQATLADLDKAIELDPNDPAQRTFRAQIHLGRGDVATAAEDLRFIGLRGRKPEDVVALLDPFIEANPNDVLARKWRGYANQQRQYALAAKPDLTQALAAMPDDLELQYWDTLADLTLVPADLDIEKVTDTGIDVQKTLAALRRLATLAVQTHDEEKARIYRWFIDRLAVSTAFLESFNDLGDLPGGWFSISPSAKTALSQYYTAFDLNRERRWADSEPLLESSMAIFQDEGYPCLSAMMALHLADTCLRTYRLDRAREAVDAAERMMFVRQQNLSKIFETSEEFLKQKTADREGVYFEIEYLPIYGVGMGPFTLHLRVVKVDLAYRLGALEQAIAEIGDLDEFCRDVAAISAFRMMFTAFVIFRDSGRFEEAERLAAEAEKLTENDPVAIATLENGRALMLMQRDDAVAAEAAVRRAIAVLGQDETNTDHTLATTLAQMLCRQGKYDEALQELDRLAGRKIRSANDEAGIHIMRATIESARGEADLANRDFEKALAIIDQLRERLDIGDRKTWQKRFSGFFEQGAMHALRNDDWAGAFDLIERSRSRALLDEIVSDVAVSPEVQTLLERRERYEARAVALEMLLAAEDGKIADYELVHASVRDESEIGRLLQEDGQLAIDAARTMLDDVKGLIRYVAGKITRAESTYAQFRVAPTLTYAEVQALLAGSNVPVVLAMYCTVNATTFLFFVRKDGESPQVVPIVSSPSELAPIQAWAKAIRAGDPAPETPDALRALIEPLVGGTAPDETIWLVPPAALYDVPLHAVEIDGQCLIDRNPIVYAPSASIMRNCRDVPRREFKDVLIVGDPLGDLPFAREEAEGIAEFVNAKALIGRAATPDAVHTQESRGAIDHMHFATHGWFEESDAMRSGIVLAAPAGSLTPDAILTAEELRRMDFDTDLIVVSGCETGRSKLDPGEEMMGLTRGLLIAGTRSLVVSLWNVADISTTYLMRRFYHCLINDRLDRAAAMREAQRWLRTLTAAEVVAELDRAAKHAVDAGDAARYVTLRTAAATTLAAAGDEAAALSICEEILGRVESGDAAEQVRALAASIQRHKGRVVSEHPFAAPYYWAPFVLVGSWD